MSTHDHAEAAAHPPAKASLFLMVWLGLVAITGGEVFLAYEHVAPGIMLSVLIGLSVLKAGMIMAYFMHLKYERFALVHEVGHDHPGLEHRQADQHAEHD